MTNEIKATLKGIIKDVKRAFPDKRITITICIVNKKAWKYHNGCPKRWTCKNINSEKCNKTYAEMKNKVSQN